MKKFAILVFLFLLLTACGDSSEKGNSIPSLSVQSVTPANNSTDVDLSISASANLSIELGASSVTPESFYLSLNGEKVPGTVTYDPLTRTVEFRPQVPLQPEERYSAVLSGAIGDIYGNTLGEDQRWEFITRKRRWGTEKQFTESNGTNLRAVADGLGNDFVAWEAFALGVNVGSYREATRDEWNASAAITQPPSSGYFSLVFANDGMAIATWVQFDSLSPFANVHASRYNPTSGTWDAPTLLENLDGDPSDLRLLTDSKGNAFVIWTQRSPDHSESHIYCNRFDNGTTEWSGAVPVEDELGKGVLRQAAISKTGILVVAWERWSGYSVDAVVSCYDVDKKSWGPPHTLAGPGTIVVQVGFDPAGRALAILATSDPVLPRTNFSIAKQDVSGDSWGEPQPFEPRPNSSSYPYFHVDSLGNIFAVWFDFNGSLFDLMVNRYDAIAGAWGTPVALEPFLSNPIPPEIAFDQRGNALLVRRVEEMVGSQIYAFRFSAKYLTWGPAEPLQRPGTWGESPVLSLGPEGQGIVAWIQWPGEYLYVRRYE